MKNNNPFLQGPDAAYFPDYSIHSPEQVRLLRQDLARAGDRLRRELDGVRSEAIENYENDLVAPIDKAASSGRAVFASWDF